MATTRKLLFDQFLLVTLKEDPNGAGGIIPFVKDVYPPDTVDPNVPLFCFPEEIDKTLAIYQNNNSSFKQSESFSFVLTDREGNQQFGFTRRILTKSYVNNKTLLIPESLCIISRYAWYSTFAKMLEILESRYHVSIEEIHKFLAAALLSVIPVPGDNFTVHIYNNPFLQQPEKTAVELPSSYILTRPLDIGKSSLHDGTLFPLIESLSSQKILSLFISLLFERRIIIYSENICKVSKFVNAAVALLDPFVWQHIFIPVLPRSLLDYCTAPMPFIIGVHSSLFPMIRKKPLNEIIFVDLDKDQVLPLPEDIALFPPQLNQLLKQCLDSQIIEWKKNKNYNNKIIVDTFRKFFVQILGTYRRFFLKDMDRKKMIFDKVSFIDSQLITPTKFFTTFCSSQMFERFIAEREEYYFKNLTPPGIFEKEVVLFDLRNPVTQSINNTLKSKEKEKEKERERERIEKEKAIAKANAYRQVLEVKKPALNPKSNGSVDRSFLSSLRGGNLMGSSTVTNTNSTSNSNDIKSHTVTAASLQQQQPQQQTDIPKTKSTANLSSTLKISNNPASIGRSTSTSFTMGSTKDLMPHPTAPSHSVSHPQLVLPPGLPTNNTSNTSSQSSLSVTSTPSSHSRSISVSDVGHMITQVAKTVTATTSNISHMVPLPHIHTGTHQKLATSPSNSSPANSSNSIPEPASEYTKHHPNSGHRKNILFRSIPFVLIHQKFSPQDVTHLSIEDLHNFLFPPAATPIIIKTSSPPNQSVIATPINVSSSQSTSNLSATVSAASLSSTTGTEHSSIKRTNSIDRNLFKIPELPENFAIPLNSIRRPRTSSTNVVSVNATVSNPISSGTNNNILPMPPMINPNYSVSQKSTLPPPPSSPHTIVRKSHHRSSSVSSSTPSSNKTSIPTRLTTSQQHQSITLTPPFQLPPPPVPSSSLLKLQSISSNSSPSSSNDNSPEINSNNNNSNQSINSSNINNVVEQVNILKASASVPKSSFVYDSPQVPSNISQSSKDNNPSMVDTSSHNPLPPLSINPAPTSSSNFFDTNPLSTPIETSLPPLSASSTNFFSDCSPLGVPSSMPVVSSGVGGSGHLNPIAQSTDAFSQFVSPMAQSSNHAFGNSVGNGSSISSTNSSILPPLLNSSGMIPPPSTSTFCTNFFDQSPLSSSSNFSDFGPPTSSFGSYNHVINNNNNNNSNTNTSTPIPNNITNNPLPPLIQPNPMAASGAIPMPSTTSSTDGMDEFDLFLQMRNQKR